MKNLKLAVAVGVWVTQAACGGETDTATRPTKIEVAWGERTCPGPYAEGPYPANEVFFGKGRANVPLPPVFVSSNDGIVTGGWPRAEVSLDGAPLGKGLNIVMCGVALEQVTRVTATAPFAIERELTWKGTRADPCNSTLPPSDCHVVQRIVYPVDVPSDAGL